MKVLDCVNLEKKHNRATISIEHFVMRRIEKKTELTNESTGKGSAGNERHQKPPIARDINTCIVMYFALGDDDIGVRVTNVRDNAIFGAKIPCLYAISEVCTK